MGPKETQQMYSRTCIDRSAIVALSAEPPGVNELCVCVYSLGMGLPPMGVCSAYYL
jgi:hypothetical protein